jgi:hypothetical protein
MQRSSIASVAFVLVLVSGAAAACSTGARAGGANPNLLTREEMINANMRHVGEAVEQLRPAWLRIRAPSGLSTENAEIVVFRDDRYLGGPELLRNFNPADVVEVRYLDGTQANARLQGYPTNIYVAGGIILVSGGS